MPHRLLAFLLSLIALHAASQPVVWTAPSLTRIAMDARPGTSDNVTIYAAKGESESFQIAVRGPSAIVNIVATDFEKSGSKEKIEKSNVVLYREHSIRIPPESASRCRYAYKPCTNPPLGAGTYPDALIPFHAPPNAPLVAVPFTVAADQNQPFWIDVHVPRNAAAGTYTATFTIVTRQAPHAVIHATLIVWNFTLPLRPALKSAFRARHTTRPFVEELLKHRLMPKDVNPADLRDLIDQFGLNITSIPFWGMDDKDKDRLKEPPAVKDIEEEARKRKFDGLPLYCYPADEISGARRLYPTLKRWGQNLHKAGIRNLVTMMPAPELYDDGLGTGQSVVDIWVVLPFQYELSADRCRYVQAKGDEVWSYNTLVQDNDSPKWHIDFAPINFRIQPGFINQSLDLTGLLYWCVDCWQRHDKKPSDPWNDGYGFFYPGDGQLLYPGENVGIAGGAVPSMRLKWLRDGVDDFDYIDLLRKSGCGDWALEVARSVGRNWSDWTRDPTALEAARLRLGNELSGATNVCHGPF